MASILVVEDEPTVASLVSSVLSGAGHQTRVIVDGTAVLQEVRSDPPDLLVLDIMLPGSTGWEICRQLREDPQVGHVPVLMMTARAEPDCVLESYRVGANDHLTKPVRIGDLIARVNEVLATQPARV